MLSHVLSFSLTALTSPWASAELANIAHASNRVLSSRDHSILYTVAHALCTQPPPFNACSELYAALRKHIFSYVHGSVFLNVVHVCMFICMYVCTCDCCLLSLSVSSLSLSLSLSPLYLLYRNFLVCLWHSCADSVLRLLREAAEVRFFSVLLFHTVNAFCPIPPFPLPPPHRHQHHQHFLFDHPLDQHHHHFFLITLLITISS